jgi:hypothetical protein
MVTGRRMVQVENQEITFTISQSLQAAPQIRETGHLELQTLPKAAKRPFDPHIAP